MPVNTAPPAPETGTRAARYAGSPLVVYEGSGSIDTTGPALVLNVSQRSTVRVPNGCTVKAPADYLTRAEREAIVAASCRVGAAWYESLDDWVHSHRGVSLGEAAAYDVTILLTEALTHVMTARRVIERDRPAELVLTSTSGMAHRAFLAMARQAGVPVRMSRSAAPSGELLLSQEPLLGAGRWARAASWGLVRAAARIAGLARPAGTRVLSTGYFRLKPLHARLSRRSDVALYTIGGSGRALTRSLLPSRQGGALALMGYLSPGQWLACRMFQRRIRTQWPAVAARLSDALRWNDLPVFPVLEPDLYRYLLTALPNARALTDGYLGLIRAERIDVIVTHQDLQGEHRLLVRCGQAAGRRTICLQHGIEPDVPGYGRHAADVCAVWGEATAAQFHRRGRATGRAVVAGDPLVGSLRTPRDPVAIRARLGLRPSDRVVLLSCERYVNHYAATDRPDTPERHLQAVCRVVRELPDAVLIARCKAPRVYHEFGGDFAAKRSIVEQEGAGRARIDTDSPLYDLLAVSDAVIITHSTIGLEAMAFGKPVLYLNFDGPEGDIMGYRASGAANVVHDAETLRAALRAALAGPVDAGRQAQADRFVRSHLANWDDADPLARLEALVLNGAGADRS